MKRLTSLEAFQMINRQTPGIQKIIRVVANYRLSEDTTRQEIGSSDTAGEMANIINDYLYQHEVGQSLTDYLLVEFTRYTSNKVPA